MEQISYRQLSIFDMFEDAFPIFEAKTKEISTKKQTIKAVKENLSDYLKKGEIIESLAKDKFEKKYGTMEYSEFEKKIFTAKMGDIPKSSTKCVLSKHLTPIAKVFRKLLKSIENFNIEDVSYKTLMDVFENHYDMTLSESELPTYYFQGRVEDKVMKVVIKDGDKQVVAHGLLKHSHSEKRRNAIFRESHENCTDLAYLFAYLFVQKTVEDEFVKCRNNPEESIFYLKNEKWLKAERIATIPECYLENEDKIYIYNSEKNIEKIKEYFPTAKPLDREAIRTRDKILVNNLDCRIIDKHYEVAKCYNNGRIDYFEQIEKVSYSKDSVYCALPNSIALGVWLCLYNDIAEEKGAEIKTMEYLNNLRGHVATAYQTKKNIPEKTLNAMKNSVFNEYFGYVEFDEDVDLKKVDEIAKEFTAVKETYFKNVDATDNAIRFRKLGKHRALGLYYPFINCLCVDINSPSSFIHEWGHLIDYKYNSLSSKANFYHIRKLYEREVDMAMSGNETYKGNSKYNRDYYMEPTEIFARSFEIYMKTYMNLENSILKTSDGYESACYPNNKEYLEAVKDYFDNIFTALLMKGGNNE